VALSEHEQRLLEQMEQALSAEDPRLASTLRGSTAQRRRRRILILSLAGFLLGVAMLVTGVVFPRLVTVGVLGFALMLICAVAGVNSRRRRSPQLFVVDPLVPGGRRVGAAAGQRDGRSGGPSQGGFGRSSGAQRARPVRSGSFMNRIETRWRRRRQERGL